jgi:hypothetical protein
MIPFRDDADDLPTDGLPISLSTLSSSAIRRSFSESGGLGNSGLGDTWLECSEVRLPTNLTDSAKGFERIFM